METFPNNSSTIIFSTTNIYWHYFYEKDVIVGTYVYIFKFN